MLSKTRKNTIAKRKSNPTNYNMTKPKPLRWSLCVEYWSKEDNQKLTTFAVGKTRKETLRNWFLQRYKGRLPENPEIPKDAYSVAWNRWAPWQTKD